MACTTPLFTGTMRSCHGDVATIKGCPIEYCNGGGFELFITFNPNSYDTMFDGYITGSGGFNQIVQIGVMANGGGTTINHGPGTYTLHLFPYSVSNGRDVVCEFQNPFIFTIPAADIAIPAPTVVVTAANCISSNGSINVTITSGLLPPPFYFELYSDPGNILIFSSGTISSNNYTFTGVAPGNYCIRVYKQFSGQKSTCYTTYCLTVPKICFLQITECGSTGRVLYIDASIVDTVLPNPSVGDVIRITLLGETSLTCWTITSVYNTLPTGVTLTGVARMADHPADCAICLSGICTPIDFTVTTNDDECGMGGSYTIIVTNNGPYDFYDDSDGTKLNVSPLYTFTQGSLTTGLYFVRIVDTSKPDCSTVAVINIDFSCPDCYQVIPCDPDVQSFYVKEPLVTDSSSPGASPSVDDPSQLVSFFFGANIYLPNPGGVPVVLEGCFTVLGPLGCGNLSSIAGVAIEVTTFLGGDCSQVCPPLTWKLIRCDDPGVFIIVNQSANFPIPTGVFNGLEILNVPGILPDQCWYAIENPPAKTRLELNAINKTFPDCECCKVKCK